MSMHHYYLNTVVVRPYIKQLLMVKLKQESRSCIWLKVRCRKFISQKAINIEDNDDVGTMHDKLSVLGANLLKTLPSIVNGTNDSISQDDTQATFASNISREDERIDWTMNAKDIHNHIRGLSPWPVGYTTMDDTNLNCIFAHIVHNKKGNRNRRND